MLGFLKSLFGSGSTLPTASPEAALPGVKSLPGPADAQSYAAQLADILSAHDAQALHQIRGALALMPEKTQDLHFGIHPDQDGEGTFSVLIHLGGPDSYVLNKAIADHRYLFNIRRVEGGMNVAVPMFDPDEVDYSVNDTIADTAADWVTRLWAEAGTDHPDLPVLVFCEDDYGDTPRWLQGKPSR